jgi:hypothetical protein
MQGNLVKEIKPFSKLRTHVAEGLNDGKLHFFLGVVRQRCETRDGSHGHNSITAYVAAIGNVGESLDGIGDDRGGFMGHELDEWRDDVAGKYSIGARVIRIHKRIILGEILENHNSFESSVVASRGEDVWQRAEKPAGHEQVGRLRLGAHVA